MVYYVYICLKMLLLGIQWLMNMLGLQIGFLYLRYAADPKTLWSWFEPYIRDDEVLYCSFLTSVCWFRFSSGSFSLYFVLYYYLDVFFLEWGISVSWTFMDSSVLRGYHEIAGCLHFGVLGPSLSWNASCSHRVGRIGYCVCCGQGVFISCYYHWRMLRFSLIVFLRTTGFWFCQNYRYCKGLDFLSWGCNVKVFDVTRALVFWRFQDISQIVYVVFSRCITNIYKPSLYENREKEPCHFLGKNCYF